MRLSKILQNVEIKNKINYRDYNIKSITHISKDVVGNSIFICIKGNNFNGENFIDEAIKNGAKCVITESEIECGSACVIVVEDVRKAMSILAKNFYNRVCDSLQIIGIVGTSGKTTTSLLIAQILSINDRNIGVIGTNGIFIGNTRLDNKFTTPDPLELHYTFFQMKMLGVKTIIMEVSAQAIYYKKIYGIKFRLGVFTNISKEHLDFFNSYEDYVRCKFSFFTKEFVDECIINTDDFYGRELAYKLNIPCVSYGIKNPANSFAIDINSDLTGTTFTANIVDDIFNLSTSLVGEYNVYNLLASMTVCKMLGMSSNDINRSVSNLKSIPGRFNVYALENNNSIVIDFAHTPDSIDKILGVIKSNMNTGRLITIFGCVGYSDKDKRIDMSRAVDNYSDYIIVTTDNRGETSFQDIVDDMILGINKSKFICIEDRVSAINFGFGMLRSNDILAIIGKGAETFQTIGKERVSYSDIEVVEKIIKK